MSNLSFVDGMDRGLIFDQFPNQAGVVSVTYANYVPGRAAGRGILPLLPVRRVDAPGHPEVTMQVVTNWGNYVPALGLELVNGRDLTFERDMKRCRGRTETRISLLPDAISTRRRFGAWVGPRRMKR